MSEVLTAAQMKAIEAAAIASGAVTGLELMERAGAGVVAAVLEEWPELALTSQRAVVLCGPGNNGGDGFVVARLLAGRGWAVEVYLYGDAGKLPPDARENYERWLEVGEVRGIPPDGDFDVIIDALFGTGLTRPLGGDLVAAIEGLVVRTLLAGPNSKTKIVAVDMVSGVCADSGRELGCPAPYFAHLTVTFHRAKAGHYMGHYTVAPWALRIVDIGLEDTEGAISLISCPRRRLGKLVGHKFSHGHALIVSGDHGHAGAARMAARAALRIGAGLVTVASPRGAMAENAARLDAVMLKPVADAAGLAEVLADVRINALCLGPGMGLDEAAAELVKVALET